MIKIKEYPPVISIMTIIEDRLLNAKSYPTVLKRLNILKVKILKFDMVKTEELFKAVLDQDEQDIEIPKASINPFKLPRE